MTAVSSPIWFDWRSPGTLIARLRWSFAPNHTPLPHFAFLLPLLKQAPSVYISIVSCLWLVASETCLCAGLREDLSGSVKSRKHSVRLALLVIVGSNRMSPFCSRATRLRSFLDGVRDRFPWRSSLKRGFSLGNICCNLVSASFAHSCGVQQFLIRSSVQSLQRQ